MALLREFAHLKRTVQWFLVYPRSGATFTPITFRTFCHAPKRNLPSLAVMPHFPSTPRQALIWSLTLDLPTLGISYKRNHTPCDLLCVASITSYAFKAQPRRSVYRNSNPLDGQIILLYGHISSRASSHQLMDIWVVSAFCYYG